MYMYNAPKYMYMYESRWECPLGMLAGSCLEMLNATFLDAISTPHVGRFHIKMSMHDASEFTHNICIVFSSLDCECAIQCIHTRTSGRPSLHAVLHNLSVAYLR